MSSWGVAVVGGKTSHLFLGGDNLYLYVRTWYVSATNHGCIFIEWSADWMVDEVVVFTLIKYTRLFCLLSFSALSRYLLPRLRVVSPVQQLSVPLQHVCCSCSLSDLLASHSLELLSAFVVFLVLIFFLFFWSGLFCCVLVPGTLAFHLPYLD